MARVRSLPAFVSLPLLSLGLAGSMALAHDSALLRAPDGSDAPRGEARIGDDEIRVRGDRLPGGAALTVWIAGPDGVLAQEFAVKTESNGSFDVRRSEENPASFAGRAVEVRGADGTAVLEGKFPARAAVEELGTGSGALEPPAGAPFPAASGRIRVKAKEGRHSLEVRVRGLADEAVYSVCAVDAAGAVEPIGKITTSGGGNGALEIDTGDGGALPFGVAGVQELAGLALQVKDEGGAVVLAGKIPALGAREEEPEEDLEVELDLTRAADASDQDIEGDVRIESRPGGDDSFRVRIRHAAADATYAVTARREDGAAEDVAKLATDGEGEAEHEARGQDVLPLGAASLSELGGAIIEVWDPDGQLVLSGKVPQVGAPPPPPPEEVERFELEVALARPDPAVLPEANGQVEFEEEDDEHEIEIELQDLTAGAMFRVELRDASNAAEVLVEAAADGDGDLRKKLVLLGSERLPFGATSFRAYDGFTIAVLDATGALVLSATIAVPGGGGAAVAADVSFSMVGSYDAPFLRGDSNRDFVVDITDPVSTLETLFLGEPFPACGDAMDANDDGEVDIADPIATLVHLFLGSRELPFPGSRIGGFDRTADGLFCRD